MELALLLVIVVLAELVVSVWLLSRHKDYLKRIKRMENNMSRLSGVLRDLADDMDSLPTANGALVGNQNISDLVAQATPEDIAQAQEILAKLGIQSSEN